MIENTMTTPQPGLQLADLGAIAGVVVAIVTLASFIFARIFHLGKVSHRLETVETSIKAVKKDVGDARKDLTKRIDDLMQMLAQKGLSESHSPRQLSKEGEKVLKNSGIDTIVDDKFDLIVKRVKAKNPNNPYQAEQAVLGVVAELAKESIVKDAIEEGAFNSGYLVESVLFVGALYIRDRVLKELNFKAEEIDKHAPVPKPSS